MFVNRLFVLVQDLSSRSPGETIDKDSFLKLFPLPGLLGGACNAPIISYLLGVSVTLSPSSHFRTTERLFHLFDRKETGVVDYEEFLQGMATCTRGSTEERVEFLFSLYDLNGCAVWFGRAHTLP